MLAIKLKNFIESNIRQRGIGNPNPMKLGRCIKEFERIYGIQNGGNRGNQYQEAEPKLSDLPWFRLADPDYVDYALRCGIFGWRKREYISVNVVVVNFRLWRMNY